jgi:C1A family cysteine protease
MMTSTVTVWTSSTTSLAESSVARIIRTTDGLAKMYDDISAAGCNTQELTTKISDAFNRLVRMTMTDTTLHIVGIIPLYEDSAATQIKLISDACAATKHNVSLHVIGLQTGLRKLFDTNCDDNDATEKANIDVLKAESQNSELGFSFSLIDDYAANGATIGFTINSFSRYLATWQIALINNYYDVLSPALLLAHQGQNISFGVSSLTFDRNAVTQQLLGLGFLSALNNVGINEQKVDAQKAANVAESFLADIEKRYPKLYDEKIRPLYRQKGISQDKVAADASKILDDDIENLKDSILDLLKNTEYTLPEKEAILATILGRDNENIRGMQYDHETKILDDACDEPINLFVDSFNKCREAGNSSLPVRGDFQALKHYVWNPETNELEGCEENKYAINPLEDIKRLKQDILNTTAFIRNKTDELEELKKATECREDVEKIRKKWNKPSGDFTTIEYKEQPLDEKYSPAPDLKIKDSVDLRKFFSPIRNQMNLGSCSSFASAAMYEAMMNRSSSKADNVMSPAFLFYYSNILTGRPTGGSNYFEQLEVLGKYGICRENLYRYDADNASIPPSNEAEDDAKSHRVLSAKQITLIDSDDKALAIRQNHKMMTSALSEGFPIGISLKIYDNFGVDGAFISHPNENPDVAESGYHAMVVVGYSEENGFYIVRNSWGAEFGEDGYCFIPSTYIDDTVYNDFACIISEISDNVQGGSAEDIPAVIANFAATETEIKIASIRNAISKANIDLASDEKLYAEYYKYYQRLVQQLTTPNVLNNLRSSSETFQNNQLSAERDNRDALHESFVARMKEFKKQARYAIAGALLYTVIFAIIWFYTRSNTIGIFTTIGIVISALMISGYKWSVRKKRRQLQEDIDNVAQKIDRIEKELNETQIKFHIAGMWMNRFHTLSNDIDNVYSRLVSFNSTLRAWQKDYSESVKALVKPEGDMFRVLDCSNLLKPFFDKNESIIVSKIDLLSVFKQYTVNVNNLAQTHEQLRDVVREAIGTLISDFSIADFMIGKQYPYISPINLQDEITLLAAVGQPSCRNKAINATTPACIILINVEPEKEEQWKYKVFPFFNIQPTLLKIGDTTTMILITFHPFPIEN